MSRGQLTRPPSPQHGHGDDTGCTILHVDMDAFYASVSLLARPELVGRPVVVGAGGRGVVLSATYEARAFGVHSAMPVGRARRLCPHATFLAPDFQAYARASKAVMAIFRDITPVVEPLSLDEAFLDVGGAIRRLGRPTGIGELIRARVSDEQRITCSVGIASNKFVAKLASTTAKPDGLLVVPRDGVIEFLHPLPVGALWGVGEKTAQQLGRLGLRTVGDLAQMPVGTLERALGPAAGRHLAALAWGRDARTVVPDESDKSVGAEETFGADVDDHVVVRREMLRLSQRVAARLRSGGWRGRTVSIKVRFADFTTITRSRTVRDPTDVAQEIYSVASDLYAALGLDRARIRLVGVRVEGLVESARVETQLLLDAPEHGWREAEQAMDRARRRFGSGSITPAALVGKADDDHRNPHGWGGGFSGD
jgi:DNA polymerase IV